MLASKVFFSFTELPDVTSHREYNAWHQLDHRPENLALPGVLHGERWVRSPDCAAASVAADPRFESFHYLNSDWLREPIDQSRLEWQALGARSLQRAGGPTSTWRSGTTCSSASRSRGTPIPACCCRPTCCRFVQPGGLATVARIGDDPAAANDLYQWYDEVRIPDMLGCPGVAGGWTFVDEGSFDPAHEGASLRFHLYFLDDDPLEVAAALAEHEAEWAAAGRGRDRAPAEAVLFAGPLRRIIPWQWDWFDDGPLGGAAAAEPTGGSVIGRRREPTSARLEEAVEALTQKVSALEDEVAIYRVLAFYGPAVDSGSPTEVAALWTEDGVYDAGLGSWTGVTRSPAWWPGPATRASSTVVRPTSSVGCPT